MKLPMHHSWRPSPLHQWLPKAEAGLNCCPVAGHWSSASCGTVRRTYPLGQGYGTYTCHEAMCLLPAQVLSVHMLRIHKVPTLSHFPRLCQYVSRNWCQRDHWFLRPTPSLCSLPTYLLHALIFFYGQSDSFRWIKEGV